ncbi:tetratricopeptide repeat protein [Leptolyngbya sp. GGD]|uniref:tetratricopeptide repeat protein n=1 Tax=Leptolyngbya sp. GGD TaxID=2997907 RepID=UPI00227C5172|nr:tetratricopeptide repeat protein [Leptolyngbya sp. GGD]MCY6492848.1 tetratricopeptide repeat protein [Leptolyngbya sp. GGD]
MNTTSNHYYKVGGSLDRDAPSYGVRQADEDFYQALKAGEFCYVLNSRQMGKSSLRVRTVARLEAEGIACSQIDITSIGSRGITASEWYWGVVRRLARSFKTSIDLKTWWQERAEASPVDRLSQFIEEVLLVEVQSSIAIFIDEIDSILNLDFKDDFFALIRTCYNQRAENPEYRRLTFALLGVATPSDLIQDKSRTPFNIGRSIDLRGLQLHEVEPLAQGLQGKAEDAIAVLKSILDWTGGQPFLTQKICQFVQSEADWIPAGQEAERVKFLVQSRVIENWEGQDEPEHLRTIRNRVQFDEQQIGELLGLYQQILRLGQVAATGRLEELDLRLTGLLVEQQGKLKVHNSIYAEVFDQAWIEQMLANLRPYAASITAWTTSERQDETQLLTGKVLRDTLVWAIGKRLSYEDYDFLNASQAAEKRIMQEANQILAAANRKARQRLNLTGVLFGIAAAVATGTGIWANTAAKAAYEARTNEKAAHERANAANRQVETAQSQLRSTNRQASQALENFQQAEREARTAKGDEKLARQALARTEKEVDSARSKLIQIEQKAEQQLVKVRQQLKAAKTERNQAIQEAQNAERDFQAFVPKMNSLIAQFNGLRKDLVINLLNLGSNMHSQKRFDDAIIAYQSGIALDPTYAPAYNGLGSVLLDQNKFDEAMNAYRKAIELDPTYAAPYSGLGSSLYYQKKLNEAATAYREAIELDPSFFAAYYNLGGVLISQQKFDEAITAFQKAAELDPKNPLPVNALGEVFRAQKKLDEAITAYRKAIEFDPKNATVYNNLGITLGEQNKFDESIAAFQKAIELNPQYARAIANLGKIYHLQGLNREALEQLNRSIELDPNLKWAIELRDKIQKSAP